MGVGHTKQETIPLLQAILLCYNLYYIVIVDTVRVVREN